MKYKVTKGTLFNQYLLWLDPVLRLTIPERDVLSAYLTLHYNHKNMDESKLNGLLFSEETKEVIRKKLKMPVNIFKKALDKLEEKEYINKDSISSKLTNYPKDFKINVEFELNEG